MKLGAKYSSSEWALLKMFSSSQVLHANFMALFSQNQSYCQWRFYIAGIGIFDLFAPLTLTFIYDQTECHNGEGMHFDCVESRLTCFMTTTHTHEFCPTVLIYNTLQ